MEKGTDYEVEYKNNTIAGTAEVNVKFLNNYSGTITKNFTIKKSTYEVQAHIIGWKYGDFSEENAPTFTVTGIDTGIVEAKDVTYFYREKTGGEQYGQRYVRKTQESTRYMLMLQSLEIIRLRIPSRWISQLRSVPLFCRRSQAVGVTTDMPILS